RTPHGARRRGPHRAAHAAQVHPQPRRTAGLDEPAARGGGGRRRPRRGRHGIRRPGRLSYAGAPQRRRPDHRPRPVAARLGRPARRRSAVPLGGAGVRPQERRRGPDGHGARRRRWPARHPRRRRRRRRPGPRVGGDRRDAGGGRPGGGSGCRPAPRSDRRPRGRRAVATRGKGEGGAMKGYLLVHADGKPYGLPVARVLEVADAGEVLDVPRSLPAVRGLTPLRGRLVPQIHLGAFLGGRGFAFNIFQVERILRYEAPAPLPKAPAFLEGVLQYQGAAVPLIDLRKRLGAAAALRDDTRTVILEFEGGRIGIVVDAVTEVMQVPATTVTPPPGIVKGLAAESISGPRA